MIEITFKNGSKVKTICPSENKRSKAKDAMYDITFYAKDSRLTEPSDGTRYDWKGMIQKFKHLGRKLTEEETKEFVIEEENGE